MPISTATAHAAAVVAPLLAHDIIPPAARSGFSRSPALPPLPFIEASAFSTFDFHLLTSLAARPMTREIYLFRKQFTKPDRSQQWRIARRFPYYCSTVGKARLVLLSHGIMFVQKRPCLSKPWRKGEPTETQFFGIGHSPDPQSTAAAVARLYLKPPVLPTTGFPPPDARDSMTLFR